MSSDKHPWAAALVCFCALSLWASSAGGTQVENHRGFYVFGHEVRTFQPCGSQKVYWVKAEDDISKRLREEYERLTSKPYEPVYVEVKGYVAKKNAVGFAADYDGQFVVHGVDFVRARQDNDCNPLAVGAD